MHNAAFRALDLDAIYLAFDVPPAALAAAIAGARALGVRQLAVSLPHKQAVMAHLDEVDETAQRIGAVNTVTRREDGALVGTNTDWIGAVRALEAVMPLADTRAVVLGAGGAARAVVFGLLARKARVTVLNRTPARARALADALGAHAAGPLEDLAREPWDVLVNTTSAGLGSDVSPVPADALRPGALVMDSRLRARAHTPAARGRGARRAHPRRQVDARSTRPPSSCASGPARDAPIEVMAAAFDAAGPARS